MQRLRVTVIETNPGRGLDQPQPKKQRAKRPGQRGPTNVPGQDKRGKTAEAGDGVATSGGSGWWSERQRRKNDAWDARRESDVLTLLAVTPQLAAQQAARRAAELQRVQSELDSTLPLPCRVDAEDSRGACCFVQTGSLACAYHGLGGATGRIKVPQYSCTTHGAQKVTAHPFQVGCVPTSPVETTIWLSLELVEQFRLLQLKDGVGGHGACFCLLMSFCAPWRPGPCILLWCMHAGHSWRL